MGYSHIVFDIDGTLIDSNYASLLSLQEAIKLCMGTKLSLQQLCFSIGLPADIILKKLNIPDKNIKYVDYVWDKCYQKYLPQILPFSGITNILEILHKKKYTLGIITSKTRFEYQKEFESLSIHKYFRYSICKDDCTQVKPSPEPLYKYIQQSNAVTKDIIYIGDTQFDMECATNASVDFALAQWGMIHSTIAAKYYLKCPADLLLILGEKYEGWNCL